MVITKSVHLYIGWSWNRGVGVISTRLICGLMCQEGVYVYHITQQSQEHRGKIWYQPLLYKHDRINVGTE